MTFVGESLDVGMGGPAWLSGLVCYRVVGTIFGLATLGCLYPFPPDLKEEEMETEEPAILIDYFTTQPGSEFRCAGADNREFNDSSYIVGVTARGLSGSAWPGSGSDVVAIGREGGPCGGWTYGLPAVDDVDDEPTLTWVTETTDTGAMNELDDCNDPEDTGLCGEADSCSGDYSVDIIPSGDSPAVSCDDFENVGVYLAWEHASSEETSGEADCTQVRGDSSCSHSTTATTMAMAPSAPGAGA